jgi:hypothetical protein
MESASIALLFDSLPSVGPCSLGELAGRCKMIDESKESDQPLFA